MEIINVLNGISNLEMVMPEFQREFVWTKEQSKQLMVSLLKNYPTGSLLFWETNEPPEIKNNAVKREKVGWTKVILDGQQRLTTLYLLIKGEIPPYYTEDDILSDPRNLFFNLETGEFLYYMKTKMEGNHLWQKVTDCFVYDKIDPFDIIELLNDKDVEFDYKSLAKTINKNLTNLRSIEKKDYPILTVPSTAKIDEAINIFDRVNSLGTKLTDAELMLTHVTGKWPQARRIVKQKIKQLSKHGFIFKIDFFARCIVVSLTGSALYKSVDHESYTKEDYMNAWDQVNKSIDFLIPILKQNAYISGTADLITTNVLVPIIAHLIKNNCKFLSNNRNGFLYWMFHALNWSRYSGQTDQRLDKDVQIAIDSQTPIIDLINQIIDQRGRIGVTPDDLQGKDAGHPLYRMLYIITKHNKAVDWANGGAISDTIGDYYSIQSHHIFPQSILYKNGYNSENHMHKKIVNEIANRAFITRDANFEISVQLPENYLPEISNQYPGALEKQFIPIDHNLWKLENFEEFLKERRVKIADGINNFLDYLKEHSEEEKEDIINWLEIIAKGENDYVEFKSTLLYCLKEQKPMKYISQMIAKSITAFLNSEGGKLFVGVSDDGSILGLSNDFKILDKSNPKDTFLIRFDNIIRDYFGKEYLHYLSPKFVSIDGKEIFVVDVLPSSKPVYLINNEKEEFYIRGSASSQPLSMKEAHDYIEMHWN
ncbi:DUF262 domain-containing protein [candidate division KSB1 bacterium]|nr:DUF262 domain-containing protein [candidate division KSB1 bacterium]